MLANPWPSRVAQLSVILTVCHLSLKERVAPLGQMSRARGIHGSSIVTRWWALSQGARRQAPESTDWSAGDRQQPRGFCSVRASDLNATITNARDQLSAAWRRVGQYERWQFLEVRVNGVVASYLALVDATRHAQTKGAAGAGRLGEEEETLVKLYFLVERRNKGGNLRVGPLPRSNHLVNNARRILYY